MQYLALAAQLPNVLFNWMNVFLQLRSTSGLDSHLYCYIYLHYYLYCYLYLHSHLHCFSGNLTPRIVWSLLVEILVLILTIVLAMVTIRVIRIIRNILCP